jgi:hypothetical protein
MLTMFPNDCMFSIIMSYEKKVLALVDLKTIFLLLVGKMPSCTRISAFYRLVVEISSSNQLVQEHYVQPIAHETFSGYYAN